MTTDPPLYAPMERPETTLKFDQKGLPIPPWRLFPYMPGDMGWRMGTGEEYLFQFHVWFERLDPASRDRYRHRHPAPFFWYWFYWDHADGWLGFVGFLGLWMVTAPLQYLSYLWFRIVKEGVS